MPTPLTHCCIAVGTGYGMEADWRHGMYQGPLVVQGVQHLFHPPVALRDWPGSDKASRLVFITRGIEREVIAGLFAAVTAVAAAAH